jgi:peptidoglycan/xylan/chitin deacetylase (PgdA/CDA1 family)
LRPRNGHLLVCFDFEGSYGMPYDVPYDLAASARGILDGLAAYQARAIFFVVGRLAEEHPQVIRALAAAGHEIGLHGYEHDDLMSYDQGRLAQLDDHMARVELLVEDITGRRPNWFRAPYLLAPRFYRAEVYSLLRDHGYRWVSNREVRYPVELLRPDRLPASPVWRRLGGGPPRLVHSSLALAALNTGLVLRETFGNSATGRLRWLLAGRAPFMRDGLVEVPIYSPLDCDLVGLPMPHMNTPPELLSYARDAVRAHAVAPNSLAMLTFHDWIVGSANRLVLLTDALSAARDAGIDVSAAAAKSYWDIQP